MTIRLEFFLLKFKLKVFCHNAGLYTFLCHLLDLTKFKFPYFIHIFVHWLIYCRLFYYDYKSNNCNQNDMDIYHWNFITGVQTLAVLILHMIRYNWVLLTTLLCYLGRQPCLRSQYCVNAKPFMPYTKFSTPFNCK